MSASGHDPEILNVQLGDQAGNDQKLKTSLRKINARAEEDSSDSWKATEFLNLVLSPCRWTVGKITKGATWAFRRVINFNLRNAQADKTRKEGQAVLVKAKAEAELTKAKARNETAKARQQEIKNETAEELLRQIKERGIDFKTSLVDGQLKVAFVKDVLALPPHDDGEAVEQKQKRTRRKSTKKKPKDKED